MIEPSQRAAVCVAVDPFLLRSALYQCLRADPRFTALLCPAGDDPTVFARANHVDAVLASTHLDIPHTQVVTVASPGPDDQPDLDGDLAALLDLIDQPSGRQSHSPASWQAPSRTGRPPLQDPYRAPLQ